MSALRQITGYIALGLLAAYWIWLLSSRAPELRRGTRGRKLHLKILGIKTVAVLGAAMVVAEIHFFAENIWQMLVMLVLGVLLGLGVRREHRQLVRPAQHRLTLVGRARQKIPAKHR